jgi:crotonobetainyl-CoA:carnitine CoA-transferase CaiB-like acyl-CoA transferase
MTQAFEGIKILDFTQVLAGPFSVMQLALLGAEVIKVEQPTTGDQTRGLMNVGEDIGLSPSFMGMNLNKRSLTLNLKSADAISIIKQLIVDTDVMVENFKAGTMERLGLGYEELKKIKPDLIYCSVTGYGQNGPKAGEAAYDGAIQASSGMMSQTGPAETGPTRTGFMPVDMGTALNTAFSISTALYRKLATGEGQRIDVAMLDTALVMQAAQYSNYLNQGTLIGLQGNASPTHQPTANVFKSCDGHVQVTALSQIQVETLFEILNLSHLLDEKQYATPDARLDNQNVHDVIAPLFATQTTRHWMETLSTQGIPVAEIRALPEVVEDEQLKVRDVFANFPSPADNSTPTQVVKAGYMMNADGPTLRTPPPLLGQHTTEILMELGMTTSDIEALKQAGTI